MSRRGKNHLVPMGLYDPPWETPPHELALDLSYQVVYGTGVPAPADYRAET